ncbi:peptidoglycan-binding protein [Streptomyces sp. NPDC020800]|uniref:peptidoglycan-binding protein n=1 Tax=Streptomyces sp. NPDC020800 TaxID=3365092 RepID=UPI00378BBAEB
MSLRPKAAALALAIAVAAGITVSTTPASANTSLGYVSGSGDWTDDWWDEGPISASSYSYSNAAAMWQTILWADGYLSYSGIDCRFGSGTTSATKSWQSNHGLTADGIVGPNTLKKASTWLYQSGADYIYQGVSGRYITFDRDDYSGAWYMYIGSDKKGLFYNTATFSVC